MHYDLYLDGEYKDINELQSVGCDGFCVAQSSPAPMELPALGVALYSRVNVEFSAKLDTAAMARLRKSFNVVCIYVDSLACLPTVAKLRPDIIQMPLENYRHIKKTFAGFLTENKIFVEMLVRDGLYNKKVLWMNGLRRLLKLRCRRNLILSSGATVFTELKSKNDILKILKLFGLSGSFALSVVDNSERLLRNAAMARYSHRNAIASLDDEGRFKRDFIINYSKLDKGAA